MRFGSVCSGLEAASVAWEPLGWQAAWFAEIEPFPSAVLEHHYPDTPNLGDLTTIAKRVLLGEVEAPDMLCGGTPCQAFSVAGLRQSLADERGNLSLKFCELADAIDHVRGLRSQQPAIVFWENVPGVLSTKDNAFGCFLAGLAGEDGELQPPGGKWANAGAVYGPTRAVAWRTLDAQYFGLAQRRRRVFVVASARNGFDPAAVPFEWDGVRRDSAPRREAGEEAAPCVTAGAGNGGPAHGARSGSAKDNLIVPYAVRTANTSANGHGVAQDVTHTLDTVNGQAVAVQAFGGNRTSGPIDVAPALLAQPGSGWKGDFESEAFLVQPGTGVRYAHYSHDYANDRITDPAGVNPALTKEAHASGNLNVAVPVAFPANLSATQHASTENLSPALGAANPTAVAFQSSQSGVRLGDTHATLDANNGPCRHNGVLTAMQVRRLTPEECEALQGFPRSYTAIPWRTWQEAARKGASYEGLLRDRGMSLRGPSREECPDGPRYKALGNSWAVPCVRWIGWRIQSHIKALNRRAA